MPIPRKIVVLNVRYKYPLQALLYPLHFNGAQSLVGFMVLLSVLRAEVGGFLFLCMSLLLMKTLCVILRDQGDG